MAKHSRSTKVGLAWKPLMRRVRPGGAPEAAFPPPPSLLTFAAWRSALIKADLPVLGTPVNIKLLQGLPWQSLVQVIAHQRHGSG